MPRANVGDIERWLHDHDTDLVAEAPPILNTWYEGFDAEDVRLIWCVIWQNNDEVAAKDVEVRWTIDGTEYFISLALAANTLVYVYRDHNASAGGTGGLLGTGTKFNAGYYVDKRGLEFKTEVRITEALGTNQLLYMYCVRETQEIT